MELHKKIESAVDNSVKYIFLSNDNLAIEATYINKNDGKNIICLPSQTSCLMGCRFCHITDIAGKIVYRNIHISEIIDMVDYIYLDMGLTDNKTLLLSFMGCGEPLFNIYKILGAMMKLRWRYLKIRFAISTSFPNGSLGDFMYFTHEVADKKLNVKVHLSLHYTLDDIRSEWMPRVDTINHSIKSLKRYKQETDNDIEIHYTLINGVNDTDDDIYFLIKQFRNTDITVKFIRYNPKESLHSNETPVERAMEIVDKLKANNVIVEYYTPPGRDIGGSCGQILTEEYLNHNISKSWNFFEK